MEGDDELLAQLNDFIDGKPLDITPEHIALLSQNPDLLTKLCKQLQADREWVSFFARKSQVSDTKIAAIRNVLDMRIPTSVHGSTPFVFDLKAPDPESPR